MLHGAGGDVRKRAYTLLLSGRSAGGRLRAAAVCYRPPAGWPAYSLGKKINNVSFGQFDSFSPLHTGLIEQATLGRIFRPKVALAKTQAKSKLEL